MERRLAAIMATDVVGHACKLPVDYDLSEGPPDVLDQSRS